MFISGVRVSALFINSRRMHRWCQFCSDRSLVMVTRFTVDDIDVHETRHGLDWSIHDVLYTRCNIVAAIQLQPSQTTRCGSIGGEGAPCPHSKVWPCVKWLHFATFVFITSLCLTFFVVILNFYSASAYRATQSAELAMLDSVWPSDSLSVTVRYHVKTRSHSIAKMTARCAQYIWVPSVISGLRYTVGNTNWTQV